MHSLAAFLRLPLKSGRSFLGVCRQRRQLIVLLAYREVTDRFAGSVIGAAWALFHPLAIMLVYAMIFGFLFRMRFPEGAGPAGADFAAYFIAGYLPWMTIQDILGRSCSTITQSHNLVKQVVFPLEVLPLRSVLAACLPQAVGTLFLLAYSLLKAGTLPLSLVLLPCVWLVEFAVLVGIAFFLSSVSVYMRDLKEFVTVCLAVGLYTLPIIFMPGSLPPTFEAILWLNPFSHLVWMHQDVAFYGAIVHPWSWPIAALFAVASFSLGYSTFGRLKQGFGNCL